MAFVENLKKTEFWKKVLLLAIVFFLVFVVTYNLVSHFSAIFLDGNFEVVYQEEWANGKWVKNLGSKAFISLIYSLYMVNKRQKLGKDRAV